MLHHQQHWWLMLLVIRGTARMLLLNADPQGKGPCTLHFALHAQSPSNEMSGHATITSRVLSK